MSDSEARTTLPTRDIYWMIAILVICRLIAHYILPMHDDAFITFRYARNFAQGIGFVYNPGEWVQGVSCPGYAFFLAGLYWLGIDLPTVTPLINIVFDIAIFFFVTRFFLSNFEWVVKGIFGALFAIGPVWNYVCGGGMEAEFFLTVTLAAIVLFSSGKEKLGFTLAVLSVYIRPEGILLPLIMLYLLIRTQRSSEIVKALVVAVIIGVPYLILSNRYYGAMLPQSLFAKSIYTGQSFGQVFQRFFFPYYVEIPLVLLAIYGAISSWLSNRLLQILSVWSMLYAAAYLAVRPMVYSWYTLPVQLPVYVFAAIGIVTITNRWSPFVKKWYRKIVIGMAFTSVAVWASVALLYGQHPTKKSVFTPLQQYCETGVFTGKTVLAYDVGVLGYYAGGYICDMNGLVWKPSDHDYDISRTIEKLKPDFLFLTAAKFNIEKVAPLLRDKEYEPVIRFSRFGENELNPTISDVPEQYYTDYIIYRKCQ